MNRFGYDVHDEISESIWGNMWFSKKIQDYVRDEASLQVIDQVNNSVKFDWSRLKGSSIIDQIYDKTKENLNEIY